MSSGLIGSFHDALFGDPSAAYNDVGQAPDPSQEAYTPEKEQAQTYGAQQVGPNALAGATGDTGAQAAQRQALARLQRNAQGGLNDSDKAALYQSLGEQAQQNRGAQGAILQGAAARGGVNSGSTLASQLAAQEASQESGANAAVNVAGQAADRAQQANTQAGSLAGQMDQTAFGKQAAIGNAQNNINAANANAANRASEFNAGAGNAANQFNIGNDIGSKQYYAGLLQQKYDNQLREAAAKSGVALTQSGQDIGLAKSIAGGIGGGVGAAAAAHGGTIGGKAAVSGDSLKNDTVPAVLSPGEIVLPRSVVKSPDKMLAFLEKETGLCFDNAVKARSKSAKTK